MKCVSGKNSYDSEEVAKEALIQNRIRFNHRKGSGPINIYECSDCGAWHFTSTGVEASFLNDDEVVKRVEKEIRLRDWADEFN